jgi:hypothetical protein
VHLWLAGPFLGAVGDPADVVSESGHDAVPVFSFPFTRPLNAPNRSPLGRMATNATSSP